MNTRFPNLLLWLSWLSLAGCASQKTTVKIKPYYPAAGENASQWISVAYIDDLFTRQEIHRTSSESDSYLNFQKRISGNNGKTWSDFIPLQRVTQQLPGGGLATFPGDYTFDPNKKILYQVIMRRQFPGKELYDFKVLDYVDHTIVSENGREVELKYEAGPDYDVQNPFDSTYLKTNRAYFGQRLTVAPDGTAYLPLVCFRKGQEVGINQGGIVLMRRDPASGSWNASNQQYISPNLSSRGLLEPEAAILENGNILIVCRGSNVKGQKHTTDPDSLQARKWYLISKDQGRTISEVQELKYTDGSRFFSPSSIHSFVRSTKNKKLYWVANIVENEPQGNSPRYPLCLVEIDEQIPGVLKESMVIIDDRQTGDDKKLQLSNFSLIEDRQTKNLELLITKIGQVQDHPGKGAVFKYKIRLPRK
ncbi:MAG: hypothetical protein KDC53_16560 [Saprospiraceae bacterium]|nr:hypothetical protein [Saprospiraceae bacterium]